MLPWKGPRNQNFTISSQYQTKSSHFRESLYKSSLKIQMKNIMIQASCLSDSLASLAYAVFLSNFSCYFSLETTQFHQQPLWYPSNDFYPQGVLKIKFLQNIDVTLIMTHFATTGRDIIANTKKL